MDASGVICSRYCLCVSQGRCCSQYLSVLCTHEVRRCVPSISRPSGPWHIGASLPCLSVVWVSQPVVWFQSTPIVSRCPSSSVNGIGGTIGVGAADVRNMLFIVRASLYLDVASDGHRFHKMSVCFQIRVSLFQAVRAPRHDWDIILGVTSFGTIVCCRETFGP